MKSLMKMNKNNYKIEKNNIKNYELFNMKKNMYYLNISKIGFYNYNLFTIEDKNSGLLISNTKTNKPHNQYISFFVPFLIKKEKNENFPLFWVNISKKIVSGNLRLKLIIFNDKIFVNKKINERTLWIEKESFFEIKFFNNKIHIKEVNLKKH
ncbi:hypothetical protein M951_chr397 (nucleomorph) [Lotharella oceanica]|uniref:Uncharacterized protein n=1 Tax=Lotharella oceanica TaxID=641309 RepID=A0A060D7R5_9EUKA|nr:hypothetical protein M951_chr397 [Lotharella oceanica]|mmetsp:Transcript_2891/g.5583  ORF Transcript_2891/g.5583 Transcript_2891/m.5583 type:complete len:153 (-) Transcript_2891:645-1103(-)